MKLSTIAITESFRQLDEIELLAKEAFPPKEYLAPAKLISMAKKKELDFLALLDGDLLVGFMAVKTHKNLAYLFFLAIAPKYRSSGYGGRALETLKGLYPSMQQVVDLEMLDDTSDNNEQRKSRRAFYIRNGYQATGQFLSYLGVDYEILCMDDNLNLEVFKEMMSTMQVEGFCPKYFGV